MKTFLTLSLSILSVLSFAATKNVSGTWHVTSNPSMKLILSSKGTFKFIGSDYSSSGTYKVDGDTIQLSWSKVDGQPVKAGSMHRALTLSTDNTITVDRYTYAR